MASCQPPAGGRAQAWAADPAQATSPADRVADGRARELAPAPVRDRAPEHNLCTSNNDGGVKRIGLPLFGFDDLTLDGEGSRFVFHGRMVPLATVMLTPLLR